ncbi:DMT family transporter [Succinimonas amylolytica]|uniref:DMT family transporter n=1 Tax=Succinimonas amylolytica TaxID=83769 RepID=UPI0023A8A93E
MIPSNSPLLGHAAALFTTAVWGITYVSTKYLTGSFDPVEILLFRLTLATVLLHLAAPGIKPRPGEEKYFALAGLSGICLYFVLENTALTVTTATNVGIIVSSAPLFTALLALPVYRDRRVLSPGFITGFLLSMSGIIMLSAGGSDMEIHPAGDLMVVAACLAWAVYSLTVKKIASFGYSNLAATRRIFLWGLLFVAPWAFPADICLSDFSRYANPQALGNLFFLGTIASALCFATWNYAVRVLGPVKTCVYIYGGPAITVIVAWLFLAEQLNAIGITGCLLTIAGLLLSSLPEGHSGLKARIAAQKSAGKQTIASDGAPQAGVPPSQNSSRQSKQE